jgi:hypothetical protein
MAAVSMENGSLECRNSVLDPPRRKFFPRSANTLVAGVAQLRRLGPPPLRQVGGPGRDTCAVHIMYTGILISKRTINQSIKKWKVSCQ